MNIKIKQQIESGLPKNFLTGLSETQINQLHKRMVSEQSAGTTMVPKTDTDKINQLKTQKQTFQVYEKEIEEDDDISLDPNKETETQNPKQVGPSTDDGFGNYDDGDMTESKKKKSKYNPWAICTSSVGRDDKEKYERCVKDVKRNIREGKNPYQVIVEMSLEKMIEKHISPRMTKKDLLNTLSEQGMIRRPMSHMMIGFVDDKKMDKPVGKGYTLDMKEQGTKTAPPVVKPGTKEKPKTSDPFKNPKHQPKPKAKIDEQGTQTAPPVVKPGTKEKPKTSDPFKNPKHQPKPKALDKPAKKMGTVEIPDYLTFDQLKINFKDQ